jgi:hypothetical protein
MAEWVGSVMLGKMATCLTAGSGGGFSPPCRHDATTIDAKADSTKIFLMVFLII